jgi:hypothetical protein
MMDITQAWGNYTFTDQPIIVSAGRTISGVTAKVSMINPPAPIPPLQFTNCYVVERGISASILAPGGVIDRYALIPLELMDDKRTLRAIRKQAISAREAKAAKKDETA